MEAALHYGQVRGQVCIQVIHVPWTLNKAKVLSGQIQT